MDMSTQPAFVGVDDGHYAVKVVTEDGRCLSVPSRARAGRHLISWQPGGEDSEGGLYTTDEGVAYTVHPHLGECADTRFRDFPKSDLNRVLVHHALRRAGFGGQPVSIATGLPVAYYYLGGVQNHALIAAKIANLARPVQCEEGPCAQIVRNVVTTEAIAAYFDAIMDMDGTPTAAYDETQAGAVGVIDVGGKTTDCAVILPGGGHVDTNRSGSSDVGVLQLSDAVEAKLRAQFGFDNVPPRMVESAIATGFIRIYGRQEPVAKIIEDARQALAESIMSIVRSKIGNGKDLEWVLFVGGGSIVMRHYLMGHFPNARMPERPEYANARGMLKVAKFVSTASHEAA